jgi:peptidoglycan/xylan/chitin deacetylase (PgdA/CDA1 family)/UDP-N-acetylglucosamine:LPS N-acetylglucosamine transferase
MNILLTLSQLEVTGAEVYAVTLADKLVENGHNVYIISDTLTIKTKAQYFPVLFNKRSFINRLIQVALLYRFIKRNKIDIINSNSRASGWISFFAAKLAGVPKIGSVHGEQAVHASSKRIRIFGGYVIPVCENIRKQLIEVFNIDSSKIEIIRNGIVFNNEPPKIKKERGRKVISLIGRLSGPKGEIAQKILRALEAEFSGCDILVIGGKNIPDYLKGFQKENIRFVGFVENLYEWIDGSDVVIGSGRVAIEALSRGVNTVAVGEACSAGLINSSNLSKALESNFGDICAQRSFDSEKLVADIRLALAGPVVTEDVICEIKKQFDVENFYNRVVSRYQSVIVNYRQRELPVLMYHRLVNSPSEAGRHGIYVTVKQFEEQMKYLLIKGYRTITFEELENVNRFDKTEKYAILTFDDGYEDNYTLLFPILKKFGLKAVIFSVTHRESNLWDTENSDEPVVRLMSSEQIAEMSEYGVEFGAHTKTHSDLTKISLLQAETEIRESKAELEKITGKSVISFAYPYGGMNDDVKRLVKEAGFKYGIATDTGPLALHEDFYHIRRIGIFPNTGKLGFARKVKGNYSFIREKRRLNRQNSK